MAVEGGMARSKGAALAFNRDKGKGKTGQGEGMKPWAISKSEGGFWGWWVGCGPDQTRWLGADRLELEE